LNVDPVCRGIAQQAAGPSEKGGPDLAFSKCVQSEQGMRQKLVNEWSTFLPTEKTNCIGAEMGGMASYTDLVSCLEMARDAPAAQSGQVATADLSRFISFISCVFAFSGQSTRPMLADGAIVVFGAVLDSILLHTRRNERLPRRLWPIVESQAECATRVWRDPDQGIWEARGSHSITCPPN
jgi:hypothetical protein